MWHQPGPWDWKGHFQDNFFITYLASCCSLVSPFLSLSLSMVSHLPELSMWLGLLTSRVVTKGRRQEPQLRASPRINTRSLLSCSIGQRSHGICPGSQGWCDRSHFPEERQGQIAEEHVRWMAVALFRKQSPWPSSLLESQPWGPLRIALSPHSFIHPLNK